MDELYEAIDISGLMAPAYVAGKGKSASTANKYFTKRLRSMPKKSINIFTYSQEYSGGGTDPLPIDGVCPSFSEIDSKKIGGASADFIDILNEDDLSEEIEVIGRGSSEEKQAAGFLDEIDDVVGGFLDEIEK
jgi:hypothetical protein